MAAYVSVGIRPKTKELLDSLKREYRVKSYDILLNRMISGMKGEILWNIFGLAPKVGEFQRGRNEFDRGL